MRGRKAADSSVFLILVTIVELWDECQALADGFPGMGLNIEECLCPF
jgi:hypothetical protein